MLAPALLLFHALEAVAAWAAYGALRALGLQWPLALIAVLIVAAGWRALVVRGLFRLAGVRSVPVGLWLRESRAFISAYLSMPVDPLHGVFTANPYAARAEPAGAAVVLVHGWFCNGSVWRPILPALRAAGVAAPLVVRLAPVLGDLDRMAQQLATSIERAFPASDKPVCLVAHSMGGLVARRYLQRYGAARQVTGLLTIGSPHHGSRVARWGIGRAARQMRTDSPWLRSLPEPGGAVDMLCIWSPVDNLVAPAESAKLEGRPELRVANCGHFELLHDPRVASAMTRFVGACGAGQGVRSQNQNVFVRAAS